VHPDGFRNCPGGHTFVHVRHALDPVIGAKVFVGHEKQLVPSVIELNFPIGHFVHSFFPDISLYVPIGQEFLVLFEHANPGGHAVHCLHVLLGQGINVLTEQ
jgi:hypothetical protein